MKWNKTSNRVWRAVGSDGSFVITQSGKRFWSQYISDAKSFKMPPKAKLSEAKEMCEESYYWEPTAEVRS